MTFMLNSLHLAAPAAAAATSGAAAPAEAAATPAGAPGPAPEGAIVPGAAPAAATVLRFAQWLGLGHTEAAPAGETGAAPEPAGLDPASRGESVAAEPEALAVEDGVLLAAMTQPITPATMAMALPVAPPARTRGGAADVSDEAAPLASAPAPAAAGAAATATLASGVAALAATEPAPTPAAAVAAASATPPAAATAAVPAAGIPASAVPPSPSAARADVPAPAVAPAPAPAANSAAPNAAADVAAAQENAPATTAERSAANWVAPAAPAAGQPTRGADTVALAGPPTAWRQTLHEALGERMNLQLGKNVEQAVIRLEPPMLGRVEIAIRHSAGALEVNITATHSEVLRQLHSVSENLRNDLAGRQYTDVAVNVAPARSQAGAQSGADQQGRGRQPEPTPEELTPGNALAEAGHPTSTFSLNGRE